MGVQIFPDVDAGSFIRGIYMTKLDKKVKSVNSEWKLKEIHRLQDTEEIIGKTYTCPKSLISFRTARKHCSSQNAF